MCEMYKLIWERKISAEEEEVQKISTSIFVTNFPDHAKTKDLWNVCKQYGQVVDAFILNRKSKAGKRYGFVQFIRVYDEDRLVSNLYTLWMGRHHLHANVARFMRPPTIKSGGYTHPNACEPTLLLDESCLNQLDYSLGLLGKVKEFSSFDNMRMVLGNEGFNDIDLRYIGGMWIMIGFKTKDTKAKFQSCLGATSWFSQIIQASKEFVIDERITWVDIEGITLKLWSESTFNRIAAKWGKMLYLEKLDEWCLYSKRLCILTTGKSNILETFKIIRKGKRFLVRAKETKGWIPDFDEQDEDNSELKDEQSIGFTKEDFDGSDVEKEWDNNVSMVPDSVKEDVNVQAEEKGNDFVVNNSLDPFELYRLLNKKKNVEEKMDKSNGIMSIPFPPGFTPCDETEVECDKKSMEYAEKKMLWDYLVHVISKWDVEVIVMGDFNEVRFKNEIFGLLFHAHGADAFNRFILQANLQEIPLGGCSFTWCHRSAKKMSDISYQEIKRVVWDCGIDKSPRPDGVNFGFIRRYWSLIEKDVVAAVQHFFTSGNFPKGCNASFIALIPKIPDAKLVKDFCPISPIGSLYKIIAKILANWLVGVLGDLVSEVQSVFVADRQILDVLLILNEVLQWCKAKKQTFIFKIDFEKAYDSVCWDFLGDVLNHFGFGAKWCGWIQECLRSSHGLSINFSKSKFMGLAVSIEKVEEVTRHIGCGILNTLFSFLGSKVGGCMSRIKSWDDVIDKMVNRLPKWKMKTLSIGGSYVGSTTYGIYSVSFFNGNDLDSKRSIWVSWNKVLMSKEKGGLGVSSLFALNRALMFKWVWIGRAGNVRYTPIWCDIIKEMDRLASHGIDLIRCRVVALNPNSGIIFWTV
uniref:DIE2/ALG10 family n=1 Tax=Tanacetum cinerariifolium TaxID=118510 RepID=A0A6L2L0C7_TANCI|nr:DIE2/ALG10 family [Tanacetum cinerariifolium]